MAIGNVGTAVLQQAAGSGVSSSTGAAGRFAEALAQAAKGPTAAAAGQTAHVAVASKQPRPAADVVAKLAHEQQRMDEVLALAQSGKTFSPAELLALQSQMYRASQQLDLAGKVVEKATGGVKQVLQTQL